MDVVAKNVALERLRSTLALLKKSSVANELVVNGKPVVSVLKELQSYLRYNDLGHLEAKTFLLPFLHILSSRTISGPYVRNALDAIQAVLRVGLFSKWEATSVTESLRQIASTVISCKFIHTDVAGDELVQVQLIETLRCLVCSSAAPLLNEQTQWQIIEFCCLTVAKTGGNPSTMLLNQTAERAVYDAVDLLLSLAVQEDSDGAAASHPSTTSLCKLLEYCVRVLKEAAGMGGKPEQGATGGMRSGTPPVHHRSLAQSAVGTPLPLNEATGDKATLHVLFVLKLLKSVLTNAAHSDRIRALIVRSPEFVRLVGDELGFSLLQLSGGSAGAGVGPGGASSATGASTPARSNGGSSPTLGAQLLSMPSGPPVVLSAVLGIFEALMHVAGPALRILVEGFARQVYLRALVQVYGLFKDQVQFLGEGAELVSPMVRVTVASVKGSASTASSSHPDGGFRLDELECILESFSDLLSDPSLLGSWFASFDCDPVSADLVQPLVEYTCRAACLAWTFSTEFSSGYFKEIATLVVQLYRHTSKTLFLRCERRSAGGGLGSAPPSTASLSAPIAAPLAVGEAGRLTSVASLFKATRGAKHVLAAAAALFVQKPEKGLKYLQERGSLPSPLTPEAVAAFLRLAPELPKETTGAFLGELGKDDDKGGYEGNTKEFHRLVLLRYVESFEFADKGVLDCMRIFLSAFWLPGESQQIDRILSAFSQHCYSQCREGRQGILENADVTYVLTFSIIMLNTDRHNPNVRADRKMTLEQFIRNNTNYGRDSNQTVPLTREFLTSIFTSIDEFPIRTEGKALAAVATSEEWADSHLQARADPRRGILISTQRNDALWRNMLDADGTAAAGREPFESILREVSPEEAPHCIVTPASIVRRLLVSSERTSCVVHPLLLSAEVSGHHGALDADLLSCIWLDMLRGALCVHIHNAAVMQRVLASELERDSFSDPAADRLPTVMKHSQLRKLISSSNSLLAELLTVATNHKLYCVLDCTNLVLLCCTGIMKGPLVTRLQDLMCWDADELNESTAGSQGPEADKAPGLAIHDSALLLYQFRHFESARLAVSTLLTVVHNYQAAVSQWNVVWFFLGGLRDCSMLPRDMVEEGEADLLPPNIRDEFETVLLEMDRRTFEQRKPVAPKRVQRHSSSILSLQGLGEALFGGSAAQSDDGAEDSPAAGEGSSSDAGSFSAYSAELANFKHAFKLDAVSARWDAGYEGSADSPRPQAERLKSTSGEGSQMPPLPGSSLKVRAGVHEGNTIPAFAIVDGGATLQDLRTLVATCSVAQLVPDSRFLPESSLDAVLRSLVCVTECKDEAVRAIAEFAEAALAEVSPEPEPEVSYAEERWSVGELLARCNTALQGRHSFSSASVAWLEMVLVEVSLRNRDRFQSFWPILKHHYIRSLCGSAVQLSYVTERRVLGILKICTRMISRDHFSGAILELLGRIFARQGPSSPSVSAGQSQKGGAVVSPVGGGSLRRGSMSPTAHDEDEGGYTLSKPQFPPMASQLLLQLSNQIAASMWRVLTLNVDILPLLPLEQWQTLFTIIAISAAAGGFAAIKSFEAMAWLLHEPRLVAKVPVFCIIGVRPLLRNPQAPLSVSVGAVHLLTHLHGRLEVLIREDKEDYVDCELDETSVDGDTPILWESCWTPILRALSEGIADTRAPVREACAEALCQAILDRHSHAVPAGVLVDILGHIIAPMIVQLRDHLVEEVNRALPGGVRKLLTSKEATALTQQQWVDVGASPNAAAEAHQDRDPSTQGERAMAALRPIPTTESGRPVGGGGTVSVLMECLSALCRSFLQHLRKLSVYPAFDKLWLCILAVLGHFLDNNLHGTAELAGIMQAWDSLPESTRLLVQDLSAMLDSSRDHLLRMLQALKQENVFRSRPGLASVSRDMIRHFEDHAEALAELEGI